MSPNRRTTLRLLAAGAGAAIAGCLSGGPSDDDGGDENGTETADGSPSEPSIESTDTAPLAVRSSRPSWLDHETNQVILVDSAERETTALESFDLPEGRREALEEFLSGIEYDSDRVLLVEGVGPDACHDRLEIESIRLEGTELRADAAVIDSSDGDVGCAEAITYPSALARVDVAGEPPDSAAVSVTDGWGETTTVTADASDSIGPDIEE
jgi:hypothetical protein